jgi:hypothetical protein
MNIKGLNLKIEKGVPIPPKAPERLVDLFRQMKPGDSVKVPGKKWGIIAGNAHMVFGKGNYAARANGTGIRVWRLK